MQTHNLQLNLACAEKLCMYNVQLPLFWAQLMNTSTPATRLLDKMEQGCSLAATVIRDFRRGFTENKAAGISALIMMGLQAGTAGLLTIGNIDAVTKAVHDPSASSIASAAGTCLFQAFLTGAGAAWLLVPVEVGQRARLADGAAAANRAKTGRIIFSGRCVLPHPRQRLLMPGA